MAISYHLDLQGTLLANHFFDGWQKRPTQKSFEAMLRNSDFIVCAVDTNTNETIGIIVAITDHVLSTYITFLEVYVPYRNKGVGSKLIKTMLDRLGNVYSIDLICDPPLRAFYQSVGMQPSTGMSIRNYSAQRGRLGRKERPSPEALQCD